MIVIIEVGSPLSQQSRRWSGGRRWKSPLRSRRSLVEKEADKDSGETNRLICGHVALRWQKKILFFKLSRSILRFSIPFPFKNVCPFLSSLCRVKLFLHQGYSKIPRSFQRRHGALTCRFCHVRLEG